MQISVYYLKAQNHCKIGQYKQITEEHLKKLPEQFVSNF